MSTKHKVSELQDELLDAAVAIAEGKPYRLYSVSFDNRFSKVRCMVARGRHPESIRRMADYDEMFEPSSPWNKGPAQALEIIERERIDTDPPQDHEIGAPDGWSAIVLSAPDDGRRAWQCGPTMQVAAMRAWVRSKLGEEVEIAEVSVPEKFPFWKRLEAQE